MLIKLCKNYQSWSGIVRLMTWILSIVGAFLFTIFLLVLTTAVDGGGWATNEYEDFIFKIFVLICLFLFPFLLILEIKTLSIKFKKKGSLEEKLDEIEHLRKSGKISHNEYEQLRSKIILTQLN